MLAWDLGQSERTTQVGWTKGRIAEMSQSEQRDSRGKWLNGGDSTCRIG